MDLVDSAMTPIQMFELKREAKLIPVSKERLEQTRKEWKLLTEAFVPIVKSVRKGATEKEMRQHIENAIKTIEERMDAHSKPSVKDTSKGVQRSSGDVQ